MPKCSVISCPNNSNYVQKKDGVSYFNFPRNPARCSEWTVIISKARNELNYKPCKGSVVCSNHFPASDIYETTKGFSRLNKNAKPILHLSKNKEVNKDDNSDQDNTHSVHDNNQQIIEQNEDKKGLSFDIDNEFRNIEEIRPQTHIVCFQEDKSRDIKQNAESIELSYKIDNEFGNNEELRQETNVVYLQEDSSREIEKSPSTSMSIGSILDTPRKTVMKRKINLCEKIIQNKNRQINTLQKQNKRLIKKNITLKNALKVLISRKV